MSIPSESTLSLTTKISKISTGSLQHLVQSNMKTYFFLKETPCQKEKVKSSANPSRAVIQASSAHTFGSSAVLLPRRCIDE